MQQRENKNGIVYMMQGERNSSILIVLGLAEQVHQIRMFGLIVCCSLVSRLSMCTNEKNVLQAMKSWEEPGNEAKFVVLCYKQAQHYLLHVHRVGIYLTKIW